MQKLCKRCAETPVNFVHGLFSTSLPKALWKLVGHHLLEGQTLSMQIVEIKEGTGRVLVTMHQPKTHIGK